MPEISYRHLVCCFFLLVTHFFVQGDEFQTTCKPGPGETLTCTTRTTPEYSPDVVFQTQKTFSHILVLQGNKVMLFPRIASHNCPTMRNQVFAEMMQQSGGSESVIWQTMLCVTLAGPLYPDGTVSEAYTKYFFDAHDTLDEQGGSITLLYIKENPGWFRCGGPSRKQMLAGHFYVGCYKTRQNFNHAR